MTWSSLPDHASVRALAAVPNVGTVPPLALSVALTPGTNPLSSSALLDRCVSVTLLPHPILAAQLIAAGAHQSGDTYIVPAPSNRPPATALVVALSGPHPATWVAGGRTPVTAALGPAVLDAIETALRAAALPALQGGRARRPRRMAGMCMRVTRAGATLRVTPATDAQRMLQVSGRPLTYGQPGRMLLTPYAAADLINQAQQVGVVVIDADAPGRLDRLGRLLETGHLVVPTPGAPGWASVHPRTATTPARPALDAATWAKKRAVVVPVALAPAVQQAADVSAAAQSRTRHDHAIQAHPSVAATAEPVLHPWQKSFVNAYLRAGPGMVNALPPGTGKTICAVAAMAQRCAGGTADVTPGGRTRAVVLAPASLRSQWAGELERFFPAARTLNVASTGEWVHQRSTWKRDPGPVVVILTPQLLARLHVLDALEDLTTAGVTDLVVDEGTYLHNSSTAQARAAWAIRVHAAHAMVLTGTPDQHGLDAAGALLAFARGQEDLFARFPLSGPHPDVPGNRALDRVGNLIFTGPPDVATRLPQAQPTAALCVPGAAERTIEDLARARVREVLATRAATGRTPIVRLRTELEAWRLGLVSPGALLESAYGLGAAARAAGLQVAPAPGTKCAWTIDRIQTVAAAGEQALVFSDFVAALDQLGHQLSEAGVRSAVLSSAASTRRRAEIVEEFAAGRLPVLLIAATGQLGLNLQAAATVVHLDVPTTSGALLQRGARAARLGNSHNHVSVFAPILEGCGDQVLFDQLTTNPRAVGLEDLARLLTGAGPQSDTTAAA